MLEGFYCARSCRKFPGDETRVIFPFGSAATVFRRDGVKKDRMKHEWQPAMVLRCASSGDCKLYEEVNVSVFEDSCWIC